MAILGEKIVQDSVGNTIRQSENDDIQIDILKFTEKRDFAQDTDFRNGGPGGNLGWKIPPGKLYRKARLPVQRFMLKLRSLNQEAQ